MGRASGGKERNAMSRKIKYSDEPIRMGERVKDFLPPPSPRFHAM